MRGRSPCHRVPDISKGLGRGSLLTVSFQSRPRPGFLHRRLIVFAIALSVLLSGIATVQAQINNWGDGTVLVKPSTLNIQPGQTQSYQLRLSAQPTVEPTDDDWWVRVFVDGAVRIDGDYKGIRWVPSVGREFNRNNWNQWRTVTIMVDHDAEVGSFLFYHDVWDHENNCPVHEVGKVRVNVVAASPLPTLSIGDATVEEGEDAEFEVTLSASSSETVRVDYATWGGTAEEGSDYTGSSGPLIFPGGTTARTVTVPTKEDNEQESTERFTVVLSGPEKATVQTGTGTGTITDDDGAPPLPPAPPPPTPLPPTPEVSIGDARADEGEVAEFEVRLSVASAQVVTVGYATMDGTALAGTDYEAAEGTLTFGAGTTVKTDYTVATVEVRTREDGLKESDEGFTVELSGPSGAVLGDGAGVGTIADDEAAPEVSIGDARVDEGGTAEFEVTLSGASDRAVTVEYGTVAGTAVAGLDYTAAAGTLTFRGGGEAGDD